MILVLRKKLLVVKQIPSLGGPREILAPSSAMEQNFGAKRRDCIKKARQRPSAPIQKKYLDAG
jgi:hypothetical protein